MVKNTKSHKLLNIRHEASPVYKKASRFKLVKSKQKSIKISLKSLINQSIVNFSHSNTRYISKSNSLSWQTRRINKYKLSNIKKSLPKKSQKNQFKIINNRLNKYKLINTNQIETNKKIIFAKYVFCHIFKKKSNF